MIRSLKVYCLFFYGVVLALASLAFFPPETIILTDSPLPFSPKGYYIDKVADERSQKDPVATIALGDNNQKTVLKKANIQGGIAVAILNFTRRNLKGNNTGLPVIVAVKELKLTESVLPDGSIDGRVKIVLSFGQAKNYGTQELVNYSSGLHYIRSLNNNKAIEAQLRSVIVSGLVYFNNWMRINLNTNAKLAMAVTFSFTDYFDKVEGDTIYYSPTRPLTWKDFQSKIRPVGPFDAMVMPGFGYELNEEIKDGVIHVHLSLKTYVAKSDCWVGGTRSAYSLNHEQRHFDITRIITRQYQQKILNAGLTPDSYHAFISMQYLDSYRDMHAMQRAYDKETLNGRDENNQQVWNSKIDRLLKE